MGVLKRSRDRQRGMTLVEVLVALVILAVVTLSVIGLFSQSIALNASGMDYTTLNNIARNTLEELTSLAFTDSRISIDPGTFDPTTMSNIKDGTVDLGPGSPYTVTFQVRELRFEKTQEGSSWQQQLSTPVDPGDGNLKEITVVVTSKKALLLGHREVTATAFRADGLS